MTLNRTSRHAADEGSVVLAVTLCVCGMLLLAVVGVVTRWSVDHRIAQSAADLAALAAAQEFLATSGDPCRSASEIAFANGTHVVACRVDSDSVWITVVRDSVRGRAIRAQARAGY